MGGELLVGGLEGSEAFGDEVFIEGAAFEGEQVAVGGLLGAGECGGDGVQTGAAVTVCGPVLASGLVDGGGDEVAVVRATRKWSPSTSPMTMRAVSVQNHREFLCGYEALLHYLRRDQRLRRCVDMHRSLDRPGPCRTGGRALIPSKSARYRAPGVGWVSAWRVGRRSSIW